MKALAFEMQGIRYHGSQTSSPTDDEEQFIHDPPPPPPPLRNAPSNNHNEGSPDSDSDEEERYLNMQREAEDAIRQAAQHRLDEDAHQLRNNADGQDDHDGHQDENEPQYSQIENIALTEHYIKLLKSASLDNSGPGLTPKILA